MTDIKDFRTKYPKRYEDIKEWFRSYKVKMGKAPNFFLNEDHDYQIDETLEIIKETEEDWALKVKREKDAKKTD